MSGAQFFADYWEKKPYFLARRNLSYYTELLTGSDLENLLSDSDMRYPALRLAKGGHYYSPEAYTRNERFGGVLNAMSALHTFRTAELPGDVLNLAARVSLSRHLLDIGFLTLAEPSRGVV